ncbi:hypothetical protein GCK72_004338 [Caenorhabditis remanei]|uniref:Uncharacterized protein n=1 Tax=Caenorhabditis remanei TaxID=31234 RepID=A0A6A5HBX1_CAERE|nr:hypothetical protein GCK72_004338 [Caenorhabditis remanei]KAF1764391.1 hypothetical protein GCK72_004338 [Caenorhabditis remanei]
MNPGPPLAYDSLKTVLQHMDPNLRIRLSINCPSIRSAEKAVPLKIKKLEFTDQSFTVDGKKYKVGIYKKYPEGMCPIVENDNKFWGRLATDLDQHGYEDWQTLDKLRPGDVNLRCSNDRVRVYQEINEVGIKKKEEEELPDLQERLDYVESFGPMTTSSFVFDEYYSEDTVEEITSYFVKEYTSEELTAHYGTQPEFEEARDKAHEELKDKILETKAILQQWYARRDGLPVPFESYIMFTISDRYTKKNIEFIKRHPVAVKLLIPQSEILRLTPGLRMEIEEMYFDGEVDCAFAELAPYIEESSYPLKCLKISVWDTAVFQHPKLRSAKHLVVGRSHEEIRWLPILLNLENHKVSYLEGSMPVDDFMTIIRHWVSCGKEVGASFSYRLELTEYEYLDIDGFHKEVFKEIKAQFKNSISGHRNANIPIDNGTTLKVSVEYSRDEYFPYNLVLQILPLEQ